MGGSLQSRTRVPPDTDSVSGSIAVGSGVGAVVGAAVAAVSVAGGGSGVSAGPPQATAISSRMGTSMKSSLMFILSRSFFLRVCRTIAPDH